MRIVALIFVVRTLSDLEYADDVVLVREDKRNLKFFSNVRTTV